MLGLGRQTYSRYETGFERIPDHHRSTIDSALGTSFVLPPGEPDPEFVEDLMEPAPRQVMSFKTHTTEYGSRITEVTRVDGSTFRVRVPPGGMEGKSRRYRRPWISASLTRGGSLGED